MKQMDKYDMIYKIKEILWRNGTTDENGVLTLNNEESEIDHTAEEIADEIINILSPITNRLDALIKEADEQTDDLPEEFDDLEDAETFNYYEGVRAAVERIRDLFSGTELDELPIRCVPGYYEFNIERNGGVIYSFGDPTESIFADKEDVTFDGVQAFAEEEADLMKQEIGLEREEVEAVKNAIIETLCRHYYGIEARE